MTAEAGHNLMKQMVSPLCVKEYEGYRLTLLLDRSQLECSADFEPLPTLEPLRSLDAALDDVGADPLEVESPDELGQEQPRWGLPAHELIWLLQHNNIVQAIDFEAVYDFCSQIDQGLEPKSTVVAQGVPPQKGQDGWFELLVKVFGGDIELREDESGRVDHRSLNTFTQINVGQKLGIVHSPKAGIDGMTVQGLPISAEPGDEFELTAGEGVVLKYHQRVAFAERAGRALWDKRVISVVDSLTISGNVDLSVGDVNFHGVVEIKGEVPDDFDVKAGKGLKIAGTVGACQIESGGTIEMNSMAGKEIGSIICHGDLHVRFLNQVSVFCYGDVLVTNEIRNCRVKSTGRIVVERGAIIGGKCVALTGIEAQQIGTLSEQRTVVNSGIYFPDADRFAYLRQRRSQVAEQIRSISETIEPLKRLINNSSAIAPTAQKRLMILEEQLNKLRREQDENRAEIKASAPQFPAGCNPKINFHKRLLEGVEIVLGDSSETVTMERRGPLSVIVNTVDGGLRYLPLSPLTVAAEETEGQLPAGEKGPDAGSAE